VQDIAYFFTCSLFTTLSVAKITNIAKTDTMINELERIWKEAAVVYSRYYPGTCFVGLRKITNNLSQDSRSPGRDLNPGPTKYEAGVLKNSALTCSWRRQCRMWGKVMVSNEQVRILNEADVAYFKILSRHEKRQSGNLVIRKTFKLGTSQIQVWNITATLTCSVIIM
jgi:hypothetical protein